jgi:hypothetical protein
MSDIKMDLSNGSTDFGDILIENNDLVMVTGKEAIKQDIVQRLRTFLGEWFLDNTIGVPYYQQILVKNPNQSNIDAIFINVILSTPGVTQLSEYSFKPNYTIRQLEIDFIAQTTDGEVDYAGLL